jgi:hypothetical protein
VMSKGYNKFGFSVAMLLLLLLLHGCGSEQNQDGGETVPVRLSIVFNSSQADQLAQTVSDIATIRVTISGPDPAVTTTETVRVSNPASGQEIPLSINAPVGSNRTISLAAFDEGNTMLFSGSRSGVNLPSGSPIPIVVALPFRVTVSKQGGGDGIITSSPDGINCGSICSALFDAGDSVTLTASAVSGSTFAGWSGGGCSGTGSCSVETTATVAARFNAAVSTATLIVTTSGTGAGTVTSTPSGINCGGTCSANFVSGNSVTLTASASGGSSFTSWSGACTGTGSCVVVMNGNRGVNAQFTAAPGTALLSVVKTGTGTVTSIPAGISCGATCAANFTSGSSVALSAAPTGGSTFNGWDGEDCSGTGACVVVMNGNQTVTATFVTSPSMVTLTVVKTGAGTGNVSSAPSGIDNCSGTCSTGFESGTSVTLSATPSGDSTFNGWGGGCSGTGTCVVTMNSPQTVTADFTAAPSTETLAVTNTGTGVGTVSSVPAGINCGATCTSDFASGASVTLTATAAAGSTFVGWTGENCPGTGTCVVSMTATRSVSAAFMLIPSAATMTVTIAGPGDGTVTSAPVGISCSNTCSAPFPSGTLVTLTAVPTSGSTFGGWDGGGCSGTATCTVVLTTDQTVDARFEEDQSTATLTVSQTGDGAGTVTSVPSGIDCGTVCIFSFVRGSTVTLTATADGDSEFGEWNGDGCNGDGACVVNMDQNRLVTARFDED